MDDQGMVRHHVAVAAVLVVAVVGRDVLAGLAPVVLGGVPLADVVDQAVDDRVLGDEATRRSSMQPVDVGLDEGLRLHRRHDLGAVDGFAIVADAGGAAGEVGGQFGVAGSDHRPAVDKDLGADLFGDDLAVQGDRAALRRRRCRS